MGWNQREASIHSPHLQERHLHIHLGLPEDQPGPGRKCQAVGAPVWRGRVTLWVQSFVMGAILVKMVRFVFVEVRMKWNGSV